MALRQRYTEDAVLYEKILRPFLKGLNEGRGTVRFRNVDRLTAAFSDLSSVPGSVCEAIWG